jgi:hypothetical protein
LSSRFHIRSPIDFRRTDPPALARVSSNSEFKKGRDLRIEDAGFDGLLGFVPFCGPFPRDVACALRCLWATLWRRLADRSCLGLCLFQVCRARSMCIARGSNRARSSASAKPALFAGAPRGVGFFAHAAITLSFAIRSWALGDVLPEVFDASTRCRRSDVRRTVRAPLA